MVKTQQSHHSGEETTMSLKCHEFKRGCDSRTLKPFMPSTLAELLTFLLTGLLGGYVEVCMFVCLQVSSLQVSK